MKKILILSAVILLIFSSCKKKSDVIPQNTITAVVNGTTVNFNVNAKALTSTQPGGITSLSISGATASDNSAAQIVVSITSTDANALTKGTYTFTSANLHPAVDPNLVYNIHDNNPGDQPFSTDPTGIQSTTVTITSISSTNVQGTFNGTLIHTNSDGTTRTVTNGKFNVAIH